MDPMSAELLAAMAGGAGGEVGRQLWAGLRTVVRRPFHRGDGGSSEVAVMRSGEAELGALEQSPEDPARAQALCTVLAKRADLDPDFSTGLQQWYEQVKLIHTGDGDVSSTISGGTFQGPVLQGRDFSGLSITSPVFPPMTPGADTQPTQG
jgi:hypothetical protein